MRFRKILPLPLTLMLILGPLVFRKGDVRVEHETPDRIAPGMRKEVTLRVHKGDRGGFAKLELEVPKGFKVKAVEKSGASFTFKDGTAKFIWMAMPQGGQFLVKYSLKAKKGMKEGERTITGKFRYLEDNKRKTVDLSDRTISVDQGAELADKEGDLADKEGDEEKGDKKQGKERSSKKGADSTQAIRTERSIKASKGSSFKVRTHVKKGKLQGFGKLVDQVPKGFDAVAIKEQGASFTFEGNKAKFVWMSMPGRRSLKVSYRLIPDTAKAGTYEVPSTFSYLKKGNTRTHVLDSSAFELKEDHGSEAGSGESDSAVSGTREDGEGEEGPATAMDSMEKKGEEEELASADGNKPRNDSLTDVPSPQKGVDFRVQICAGHDQVADDHFEQVYGYDGDYDIDHHKGWLKYLTGKFDAYKKARDKRVYFRTNFDLPGPFVTAYNDGERITVQEALMVTDQEWVQ